MPVERYAVVQEGRVANIIVWDIETAPNWTPPKGATLVMLTEAHPYVGFGDTWDGAKFTAFVPPPPPIDELKAAATRDIQRAFSVLSSSMFVDERKREDLRLVAVNAAANVAAVSSPEEIATAQVEGITAMRALT